MVRIQFWASWKATSWARGEEDLAKPRPHPKQNLSPQSPLPWQDRSLGLNVPMEGMGLGWALRLLGTTGQPVLNPGPRLGGREEGCYTGQVRRSCSLRGRESRGARERTGGPASFIHTSQYWGRWGQPWRRSPACLPTSNDQILQGGPGIGEIPLLACVPERGWNPVLVGQDLAVLEGSRHCWDCRWGLGREPGCWALREQKALPVPPLLSSRLSPGGLSGTRREDRHRQQWVGGWSARFLLSE